LLLLHAALQSIGVELEDKGHIVVDEYQNTNVAGVYAVGDVIDKHVDLTPMAIAAGRKLADRLFGGRPQAKVHIHILPATSYY
jgi:glutathione reductase (NADPH)